MEDGEAGGPRIVLPRPWGWMPNLNEVSPANGHEQFVTGGGGPLPGRSLLKLSKGRTKVGGPAGLRSSGLGRKVTVWTVTHLLLELLPYQL